MQVTKSHDGVKVQIKADIGFINEQPILYLALVMIASVLTSMAVSLLTERIAYRPLRRAPRLVPLITAIGASFFWQYIFRGGDAPAHECAAAALTRALAVVSVSCI